jgi:cytochrome c peroxidase
MPNPRRANSGSGSVRAVLRVAVAVGLLVCTVSLGQREPARQRLASVSRSLASEATAREPAARNRPAEIATRIELGRRLFFDPGLSEPVGTSCASCHEPALGYAGVNGSTTGVARGSRTGRFAARTTPSVLYLRFVRRFHVRWDEDAPLPDAVGGFFWDGRSDSIAELVRQPLLNPDEMGNESARQIAEKLAARPYASQFSAAFGPILTDPDATLRRVGSAIEAFLLSDEMAPFSSRYDDYVQGHGTLSALEQRGLSLFKDRAKGSCATCHRLNDELSDPARSVFSDFGYETVAVPRNPALAANATSDHFDLGLCRADHARPFNREERWCGAFRTPSLRNVALRPSFMHNGAFTKLRDVVAFYATRGTEPERWYKSGTAYEDLPPEYRGLVNVDIPPYDRGRGKPPRLDDSEIDAIVAFLGTLSDQKLPSTVR